MKNTISVLNSIDRLPPSIRSDFWIAFTKAFEDEILEMISQIETKKTIYDIENMTYDQLLEITEILGVPFNATINDSIDFLRSEVRAIPFKIQFKDTVIVYQSFYKALSRLGQVYVYFFKTSSDSIVRSTKNLLLDLGGQDVTTPYIHRSAENYTGFIENALKLDTGLVLDVENEGEIWTLDTVDSQITTNHLGVEFFIDRLITKSWLNPETRQFEPREYLMTWEYHDFVQVNVDFSRRVVQVPHVGSHINIVLDNSGFVNPYDSEFTCPEIKLKGVTNIVALANLNSYLEIDKIEFGVGAYEDLPVKEGGGTFPTKLHTRIAEKQVLFDEKYDNEDFYGSVAEYKGQQVNNFVIHDASGYKLSDTFGSGIVDGTNNNFQGELLFSPLQKQNIRFKFKKDLEEILIEDDGKGLLISEGASGVIDYDTGRYVFSTNFIYETQEEVATGDGEETLFTVEELPHDSDIVSDPVSPKVKVLYNIGNRRYIAFDDGLGVISGAFITVGTIDYITGELHLDFSEPITENETILIFYSFQRIYTPDAGSKVEVDYYFTNTVVEITEVGLWDEFNNLLAYATFPPIEFNKARNHLNFGFIIKKTPFTSQIL